MHMCILNVHVYFEMQICVSNLLYQKTNVQKSHSKYTCVLQKTNVILCMKKKQSEIDRR